MNDDAPLITLGSLPGLSWQESALSLPAATNRGIPAAVTAAAAALSECDPPSPRDMVTSDFPTVPALFTSWITHSSALITSDTPPMSSCSALTAMTDAALDDPNDLDAASPAQSEPWA